MKDIDTIKLDCGLGLRDKHPDCCHDLEDWDRINNARPFLVRLKRNIRIKWHHWFLNPLDEYFRLPFRTFKGRLRCFRYGYDPNRWWEHFSEVSRMAISHLTDMRDKGHGTKPFGVSYIQGVSFNDEGRSEWKSMLDDMIFFHQVISGSLPERKITYTSSSGKNAGKIISYMNNPEFRDLTPEEQKTYRRGKFYYFKHFESLWD